MFNSGDRIERSDDTRLHELNVVVRYFVDWKEELQKKFKTKKCHPILSAGRPCLIYKLVKNSRFLCLDRDDFLFRHLISFV